jgi:hypothetical protein
MLVSSAVDHGVDPQYIHKHQLQVYPGIQFFFSVKHYFIVGKNIVHVHITGVK